DGKTLAVGYADHSVRLADSRTGRVIARSVLDAGSWVKGLAFAPDGRTLAAATMGPTVHLLDAKTASPQSRLKTPGDAVRVAFARNGTLATVQQDGTVRLWNPTSGQEIRRMEGSIRATSHPALAFSADGMRVAAVAGSINPGPHKGRDGINIWDT